MDRLALKVPPVAIMGIVAGLMWGVSRALPEMQNLASVGNYLALVCFVLGVLIPLLGVRAFRQAQTTVNPLAPQQARVLVQTGVYARTRNPMYLGFLLLLMGWGFLLQSGYALILCAGFVTYMNRFQIQPEEQTLRQLFPESYPAYQHKVRRWC
ncbi:methyltransferase family protein [Photobacterium atrarenae]|uniref:Isoprenylcysteine carboxylmethyltransferase family protein n=1 Tax=Photobacterium atrarenae TaxID=865757 RepID=A0ABY5GLD3_9GAMM|nr:isoprenylcysteine carboxylmethyltransferase family protein [Photobacterium atrarenae]UTV30128.1 isoprenylcysteine carboxylmethyltransferase family protein [Photobacterium atrarenae]